MNSILNSIKKLLGIHEEVTDFDTDIIIHINSTFMILNQLGVGPEAGFSILDDSATWDEYLIEPNKLELVKSYVYLRVRKLFDPPQQSNLGQAIDQQIAEFEWRLNVAVDPKEE